MPEFLACSRRQFREKSALAAGGVMMANISPAAGTAAKKARIAITFDLEMVMNFPKWEDSHWNYEKGNLTEPTKRYALEAARRIKARGGVVHGFLVGRLLEQENIDWLKEFIAMGHQVGNHSYDHVALLAKTPEATQFRFQRAPWLIQGKSVSEILRDNIRMTNDAFESRLGIRPSGFRAPGGLRYGLNDRVDLQTMMLELGFSWVSTLYPPHAVPAGGAAPTDAMIAEIQKISAALRPYLYPTGLIEAPMNPISDVTAFRNGWRLEHFLESTRLGVERTIREGGVLDFMCHPAVLSNKDPEFRTLDLICDLVARAGGRAGIVDLATIANEAKTRPV